MVMMQVLVASIMLTVFERQHISWCTKDILKLLCGEQLVIRFVVISVIWRISLKER